ncbi:bifunctional metallophosphatase/5'-nucleotidase [Enterococcus sp. RIT-PI-f]|uniref:bifunctional metallophosphatase/5'-nucleotidase n=1 Tax=Enterococcus sp. RIT-PI-f TaxID=1690244 RepID=UPI0006B9D8EC|nr:bifunctional UDP-sugar hydrolase/5'-nucleotidase [Enterococcus sp. RIT-PI-f]KPG70657.1 5'-nucleotidase [Enterococcus sp. RIT-PI-f]
MEKITIIHTNDIHSHLENWPKIRRYLDQRQREAIAIDESVVTVDLGDFVDRWHPLTEATNGQANVDLMNQGHYDAVTIGNNEGVGNPKEDLQHLYDLAEFPVILGNLFDKKDLQPPTWAKEYQIIETKTGTKIGLIAFTAPFPLTYAPNGWDIREPMEILPSLVAHLRPKVDVLVLMSHLGINADREIALNFPQLDVVLGSHTHHLFEHGETVNGVQIAAAGKFGMYIGEVELQLTDDHTIMEKSARVIPTLGLMAFPQDEEEIDSYLSIGHRLLRANQVALLPHALTEQQTDHSLIKAALLALCKAGDTEAAVLNTGLFLGDLPAGIVDQDQLHTILPHPMHLIKVTLAGNDLVRMVLEMEKNRAFLRRFPIVGMGFRGQIFGELVYEGIQYDETNHQVLWQQHPVDPKQSYTITLVDHYLFIPFFPTIEIAGRVTFLFPDFIRTVVGNYLSARYPLL